MGRKAPSPGPPTTMRNPTTGSWWKALRTTLGLPRTACVFGGAPVVGATGLATAAAPARKDCVLGLPGSRVALLASRTAWAALPAGGASATGNSAGRALPVVGLRGSAAAP